MTFAGLDFTQRTYPTKLIVMSTKTSPQTNESLPLVLNMQATGSGDRAQRVTLRHVDTFVGVEALTMSNEQASGNTSSIPTAARS